MPQKQPPASTAVCSPLTFASGASMVGLGMGPDLFADTLVTLQALIVGINNVKTRSPESLSKYVFMSDIRGFDINRIGWLSQVRIVPGSQRLVGEANEIPVAHNASCG